MKPEAFRFEGPSEGKKKNGEGNGTPLVFLPEKSHWQRSLVGCSPWGREGSDTTERLHFHFSLSCIGEGNGNPIQCSCLENPRDGGAWWAVVYGVAQSQTRLKRPNSSSSSWEKKTIQICNYEIVRAVLMALEGTYTRERTLLPSWHICLCG